MCLHNGVYDNRSSYRIATVCNLYTIGNLSFPGIGITAGCGICLAICARKSAIHAHMTHESGLESVVPIAEAKILFQRKLEELKAPVIYVEGEEKGFSFWRSELMGNDIDLCVSYRIENPLQLLGLFSYDMDQRAKVHKMDWLYRQWK